MGTWQGENPWIWEVPPATAAAQLKVSYCSALALYFPPCPRQRPSGSKNSQPASSARRATQTSSSQSSLLLAAPDTIIPPLTFRQKTPSLRALSVKKDRWSCVASCAVMALPP